MTRPNADVLISLLSRPQCYPQPNTSVELVETHLSWVFLTDELVYKLKKPVHFEFADFRTLAARRAACHDELRLNRRLAPHVYLDVVQLRVSGLAVLFTEADHSVDGLDEDRDAIEYAVRMRRLPDGRMLDHLIRSGRLDSGEVDEFAERLATFYSSAAAVTADTGAYRRSIEHHVRANRADLLDAADPRDDALVRRVHAAQLRLLHLYADAFDTRVSEGRVIEGHGDLRPEHVCLIDPPVVFDCVEFSRELRTLDIADELAFLAMECDSLDAADVGQRVLDAYARRSHDNPPPMLWNFYKSYRACVRAKVAALRAAQVTGDERNALLADADKRLRLAESYERQFGRPTLLVVGGLMGTGKSTVAAALGEALGFDCLRTDVVRGELFGDAPSADGFASGRYSDENRRRVYDEVFHRAEAMLTTGVSLILDGTFLADAEIAPSRDLAERHGAALLVVRCECPDDLARQRIAQRSAAGNDASEARPELFDQQKRRQCTSAIDVPRLVLDTSLPVARLLPEVYQRLRADEERS
ncbi:MAG: AAA family ATPase [Pirellulales bacterium]